MVVGLLVGRTVLWATSWVRYLREEQRWNRRALGEAFRLLGEIDRDYEGKTAALAERVSADEKQADERWKDTKRISADKWAREMAAQIATGKRAQSATPSYGEAIGAPVRSALARRLAEARGGADAERRADTTALSMALTDAAPGRGRGEAPVLSQQLAGGGGRRAPVKARRRKD